MPARRSAPESALDWAIAIIVREMQRGIFGHVALHMQKGRITRVEVKSTEEPRNYSGSLPIDRA